MSESSVLEPHRPHNRAYNNLEHDRRYDDFDRRYRTSSVERDRYSRGRTNNALGTTVPPQPRRSGTNPAVRHTDKVVNYPPSELTEDASLLIDDESQYNA